MVTVEIHGIGKNARGKTLAREISEKLKSIPNSKSFLESQFRIVVVDDYSEDENPFLRIFFSSFPSSRKIRSQALDIMREMCDVEVVELFRSFKRGK